MTSIARASELRRLSVPLSTLFPSSAKVWNALDDYQKNAVCFIHRVRTAALFFEQGLGKTWIAAGVLEFLGPNQSSLVVVPKNNKETSWLSLLRSYFPHVYDNWVEFKAAKYGGILVLHYEEFTRNKKVLNKLLRRDWTAIIFDESQRLKDRGSKASRAAARLGRRAEYRVALTGTPLDGDPIDVWAQMRFVNEDVFGSDWGEFSDTYLEPYGWMNKKRRMREGMRNDFDMALRTYAIRQDDEILGLPKMTTRVVWCDMSPKQKAAYFDMRVFKQVRLTREVNVQAPLTITRDAYLSQIVGGFIQDQEGSVWWLSHRKVLAVQKIIRENPKPVVVFFRFIPELLMLERVLGKHYRVATYYGKTKNKAEVERNFQAGEYDILLCQIRAGGVGINLFNGRTCILYSGNWSSIDFHQLRKRVHRRGQKHPTTFFLVLMRKSIDVKLRRRILAKSNANAETLTKLRR